MNDEFQTIRTRDEKASLSVCDKMLERLSGELDKKLKDGAYTVPGGYKIYKADLDSVCQQYENAPGKGIKVGFTRSYLWHAK